MNIFRGRRRLKRDPQKFNFMECSNQVFEYSLNEQFTALRLKFKCHSSSPGLLIKLICTIFSAYLTCCLSKTVGHATLFLLLKAKLVA